MIIVSGAGAVTGGALPTDLSDLELWLPVSALALADGANVNTWPDQSGNSRDATGTSGGGADRPLYDTTGGPTNGPRVRVTPTAPTAAWFTLPDFLTGFTAGEAFVVPIIDADPGTGANASGGPPLGDWGSATTGALYPFWTDSKIYEEVGTTVRKTTLDPVTSLATWHVYNMRSASGSWIYSINGATSGNDFFSTGTNTVGWGTAPLIGKGEARLMFGSLVDIIFFSRILDDATERKPVIHQYLNDTYGFSLPTS